MVLTVQPLQPFAGDVGIDLGCRQVAVAKQQLHHPQVGTMIQQVGGEGVTQRVRGERMGNTCCQRVLFNTVPERLTGHTGTPPGREEFGAGPALE